MGLKKSTNTPRPVMRRLMLPLMTMVFFLLAGGVILLWQQHQASMNKQMATLNASISSELKVDLKNQAAILGMALQSIVDDPRVLQGLRDNDRDRFLSDWQPVFERFQQEQSFTHFNFIDKNRVILLRLQKPEKHGDRTDLFTTLEAERTGKPASGIEIGQVGTIVLRVIQPVFQGNQLLGYVELGKEIGDILHERHIQSGSHLAVTIYKENLNRRQWEDAMARLGREANWETLSGSVIVYASHGRLPEAFIKVAAHDSETGHTPDTKISDVFTDEKHWLISETPLQNTAGKAIGRILVMSDITAEQAGFFQTLTFVGVFGGVVLASLLSFIVILLRRTDEGLRFQQTELRESEELLSATLSSIGDGVISTDSAGRVVSLNEMAEKLTGWDSLDARGCPIVEIFHIVNAKTRDLVENPVEQCLREGKSVGLANHTVLIRRDGSESHIADSCAPIRDSQGMVIGAVLVFRDVSEEYRYRQELRESEEKYRLLADNALSAVAVHEILMDEAGNPKDYIFLSVNPAFESHTGLSGNEVLGRSISEVMPGVEQSLVDVLHQVALTGNAKSFELYSAYLDRHFLIHAYRLPPSRLAIVFTDITQQKRAEDRLKSIFKVAPTGIGVVRDRVFLEVNQRICEMTKYDEEELIGENARILYPSQEDYDNAGQTKYGQIAEKGTGVIETRWRRKDGGIIDVLVSSTPLDSADWSQGVTFTALDITDRKRAEDALRESERKLSNWMGNLPGIAYRCRNDQNWTMEFISEGCHKLTGYFPEDLRDVYADIIHPEDRENVWQTVQEALREKRPFQVEFRIITAGGNERWVWEQGVGVFSDEKTVEAIEGVILDITHRKLMETALTESEARYRSLFENHHATMLIIDAVTGEVVDANPAAIKWYGWSRKEICQKNICDINTLNQREWQAEMALANSKKDGHFIFCHRLADGTLRDVEVFNGLVNVTGRQLLFAIVHDITEKKQAEAALEKRMVALTRPLDDATGITFEELFNLNDIQKLQDDFARATGVASMIVCPDGIPITASSSFCRLCRDVRATEKGRANCCRSDVLLGQPSASGPTIQKCLSAGLWDAGAAILVGGHHIANWLVGQVRDGTQSEEEIRAYAHEIGTDETAMVEAFREVPVMSYERFAQVAQALFTLANQLSGSAYQNVQQARFITEQKQDREKIAFLAHHDQLTGLANRTLFAERFAQAAGHALRTKTRLAMCMLDLDGFKAINDSHGHPLGDQLLCEVANRLKDSARISDTVGRIGGDEFVILFTDLRETQSVTALIHKILACFEADFNLDGALHSVRASLGVAIFPEDGADFSTLFEHADAAMYFAKESGRNNVQFFHREINDRIQHRLTVEKELRQALLDEQLELHYQPIIQLPEKRLAGMEALVRWRHPEKGLISPDQFIPVAEESNLIVSLGQWVLKAACRDMAAWRNLGLPALPVSVNVSARQLFEKDFAEFVGQTLVDYELPPYQLELEVTENIFLESSASVEKVMNDLKDIGVGLILDDFGTGYSSLSYLKLFRIEKLKIDRAFMEFVCHNKQDAILVTTIIRMAQNLGMDVVAEGVETAEQVQFLIDHNCELAQGFFFSKPLPLNVMQEMLGHHLAGGEQIFGAAP